MTVEAEVADIEATLRAYIASEFAGGTETAIDPDDELLASGLIDSMGVVTLTAYVQERFDVAVEDEEIVPDNFRSLRAITLLVAGKKGIKMEDPFVTAIRSLVLEAVPQDAVVLVFSHGEGAALELDGRTGWHFPRDERGDHPGYGPADGADAVRQIEDLRRQGATHIVFAQGDLWWLDEYPELREYLVGQADQAEHRSDAGAVFPLRPAD